MAHETGNANLPESGRSLVSLVELVTFKAQDTAGIYETLVMGGAKTKNEKPKNSALKCFF